MNTIALKLGVVGLCAVGAISCATYSAENQRLLVSLEQSRQAALEQQLRLVQLEQRFAQLEGAPLGQSARRLSGELTPALEKLDELILQNQQLLMQMAARGSSQGPALEGSADDGFTLPVSCADGSDPRDQLRYWAARVRADHTSFRGGLSPEQNYALNLLLRRERLLDPQNPWHE
jgi:hypothetical protein